MGVTFWKSLCGVSIIRSGAPDSIPFIMCTQQEGYILLAASPPPPSPNICHLCPFIPLSPRTMPMHTCWIYTFITLPFHFCFTHSPAVMAGADCTYHTDWALYMSFNLHSAHAHAPMPCSFEPPSSHAILSFCAQARPWRMLFGPAARESRLARS